MKIFEIINLLTPLAYDPNSYVERLTQGSDKLFDEHTAAHLSRFYETDNIDRLFANEINSLYYLGLVNEFEFQVMYPMNYFAHIISKAEEEVKKSNGILKEKEDMYSLMPNFPYLRPKERLSSILKNDGDIRQWYSDWLGDLIKYQCKTISKMNSLYNEIRVSKGR